MQTYRDKLDQQCATDRQPDDNETAQSKDKLDSTKAVYAAVRRVRANRLEYLTESWRYPLWQVGNRPELFAYKSGNGADGVCLIELMNLPDQRIVVAAIGVAGNPGNSVTNCVEDLCFQVCERFAIPAERLVWHEHYDYGSKEWDRVTFAQCPPNGPFGGPQWTTMDAEAWRELRLRPKKRLRRVHNEYDSKLHKKFPWPNEALDY